jgi:putative addiction module killer protein
MANVVTRLQIEQTDHFKSWLVALRDGKARARIVSRLTRLRLGNFGDVKALGGKLSELRVDHGPGYRVYFTQRGKTIYLLLCGGDKRTQNSDITIARGLIAEL